MAPPLPRRWRLEEHIPGSTLDCGEVCLPAQPQIVDDAAIQGADHEPVGHERRFQQCRQQQRLVGGVAGPAIQGATSAPEDPAVRLIRHLVRDEAEDPLDVVFQGRREVVDGAGCRCGHHRPGIEAGRSLAGQRHAGAKHPADGQPGDAEECATGDWEPRVRTALGERPARADAARHRAASPQFRAGPAPRPSGVDARLLCRLER